MQRSYFILRGICMEIVWKRLIYQGKDYGDYYLVSNTGEIKGVKTGKVRSKNLTHTGYYFVNGSLGSRKNKITFKVHKAVAETFIDNPDFLPMVNHKDGNKLNNEVNNLEWCTAKENTVHAVDLGLLTNEHVSLSIICLNNCRVFESIVDAANWCNCARSNISDYLNNRRKRKSAGKHPETNQPLQWMYYEDYLREYKKAP